MNTKLWSNITLLRAKVSTFAIDLLISTPLEPGFLAVLISMSYKVKERACNKWTCIESSALGSKHLVLRSCVCIHKACLESDSTLWVSEIEYRYTARPLLKSCAKLNLHICSYKGVTF